MWLYNYYIFIFPLTLFYSFSNMKWQNWWKKPAISVNLKPRFIYRLSPHIARDFMWLQSNIYCHTDLTKQSWFFCLASQLEEESGSHCQIGCMSYNRWLYFPFWCEAVQDEFSFYYFYCFSGRAGLAKQLRFTDLIYFNFHFLQGCF